MRKERKQQEIEDRVYDCFTELSDILSIDTLFYPEVVWLGQKPEFNSLLLPKCLLPVIKERWQNGISSYLIDQRMVLICPRCTRHSVLEEASHAFHFINSSLSYAGRSGKERTVLRILIEMMGLLGARLLGSDFENPYVDFPDLAKLTEESLKKNKKALEKKFGSGFDFCRFFIYQQGYGLADLIYLEYLSGRVSRKRLKKLFLNKINGPGGALALFSRLKREFWPAPSC